MHFDHGAKFVGKRARGGVDAIAERRDVRYVDSVGWLDNLGFAVRNPIEHEVDGDILQTFSSEQGRKGDVESRSVVVFGLDRLASDKFEGYEVLEVDGCKMLEFGKRFVDIRFLRKQVDVSGGSCIRSTCKHALASLQHKRRVLPAEYAAQESMEVETRDGSPSVKR